MVFRINNCIFAFKLVLIHYPDVNNIIHSPLNSHLIMRNSHIRLAILLMAICCFCFPLDALSQKDSKKAKKEKVQYRQLPKMTEVSEMVSASRPDRPGADIRKPVLFGGRRVGILGKAGIDVSHYQGRINWYEVARDQKVTFVIMKATESDDFVDETYDYNFREAKRQGLKVGSYHFYRAHVSPEIQFRNMMRHIDPKQQDILPVIDVELTNGVSYELFVNRLERLCQMVTEAFGARPIIYTGRNFFAKYFNNFRWRNYKFWIAAYSSSQPELPDNRDYIMWQFTDNSRVQGIRGGVDMSRFVNGHTIDDILYKKR